MQRDWSIPKVNNELPFPALDEIFSWDEVTCNAWIQTLSPEGEKKLAKMLAENRIKIEQSRGDNAMRSGNTTPEDMSSHSSDAPTRPGPRVYHTSFNLPGKNFFQSECVVSPCLQTKAPN